MDVTNGPVSPEELSVLEAMLAGVSRDEADWKVFELLCRNYMPWRCGPLSPLPPACALRPCATVLRSHATCLRAAVLQVPGLVVRRVPLRLRVPRVQACQVR